MIIISRRLILILTVLTALAFYFMPAQEAKAIDPVTLAILTPLAIQGAKILAPYVLRGIKHMGTVLIRCGKHLIGLLRLPLGFLQCTLFAPWAFSSGLANIGVGLISPVKLIGNILLLPLSMFGIGV